MRFNSRVGSRMLALAAILALIVPSAGCIGMLVQAANLFGMNSIPAKYNGLKGRRVAVVVESPESVGGPDATSERLSDELEGYLERTVRRIEFVSRDEVANWQELRAGNVPDYQKLGKSVDADLVVVVDLNSFSYHDNQTIYQGKCDYDVTVYDVAANKIVFEDANPEFAHPTSGGYQLTEMREDKFHREFVKLIAADVGRLFHANDFPKQFAKEHYIR